MPINKTIVRNIMLSTLLGAAALSLPKLVSACDQKCQCNNLAAQNWRNCLAVCNEPQCDDCSAPNAQCNFNDAFEGGEPINMCQYGVSCNSACGAELADNHEQCDFFD